MRKEAPTDVRGKILQQFIYPYPERICFRSRLYTVTPFATLQPSSLGSLTRPVDVCFFPPYRDEPVSKAVRYGGALF